MANTALGLALKKLRQQAERTQQWAADQLSLKNKSTLASWEGGKAEPDICTFLQLCCLYGVAEANALAEKLELKGTASWDFSPITTEEIQEGVALPNYSFCPYCGKRLPKSEESPEE